MCTPVTPAVPYLLLGLQDVQWAVGNSRGARKLARTPHVNQKKKNNNNKIIHENDFLYETSSNLKFLSLSLIMTHDEISFFLS
jgi:hypothetical protein